MVQRHNNFYREYDELGQIVSGHNMHVLSLCFKLHPFVSPMTALKIILIYVQGCEKRNPTQILMDMHEIGSRNFDFIILDRYSFYQASTLILDRYDSIETFVEL